MKKTTAIFLSVLIIMSAVITVFASNPDNRVYAEKVTVEAGEQVTIPVKIENNKGFMGFAITVTYDDGCLTPVSVSKGSVLTGMFNDSIATSTDNSFKVVFTGTGNITADGELFKITFDVSDDASGTYDVELSYSQQDTFKEDWSDVVFDCESAEIVVTVNGTTAPETTVVSTTVTTTEQEETTSGSSVTEPDSDETTTRPVTEPSTEPSTEPADEPEEGKPLSVRMNEWVNGLPFPMNIIIGIFVIPVAFFVSIFE